MQGGDHLTISGDRIAFLLSVFIIVISPLENIIGIESIVYPIVTVLLMFTLLGKRQVRITESFFLLFYLFYAFITCLWTKADNSIYGMRITILMFLILFLFSQFDFTEHEYEILENAMIIHGLVLLLLCFTFGQYSDNRFWIISSTTGADPNYLSQWFILPICICIKKVFETSIKWFVKPVLIIEIILAFYFIMQSGSRSGLICTFAALVICAIYENRTVIKEKPLFGIIIFAGFLVLFIALLQMVPSYTLYRFETDNGALGGRASIWRELIGILNKDLIGTFIGMGEGSTTYYTSSHIVAHNTYLDVLFENGLIGLFFYVSYCISILRKSFLKDRTITIALVINLILIFTLSSINMRPTIFAFFMAECNVLRDDEEDVVDADRQLT